MGVYGAGPAHAGGGIADARAVGVIDAGDALAQRPITAQIGRAVTVSKAGDAAQIRVAAAIGAVAVGQAAHTALLIRLAATVGAVPIREALYAGPRRLITARPRAIAVGDAGDALPIGHPAAAIGAIPIGETGDTAPLRHLAALIATVPIGETVHTLLIATSTAGAVSVHLAALAPVVRAAAGVHPGAILVISAVYAGAADADAWITISIIEAGLTLALSGAAATIGAVAVGLTLHTQASHHIAAPAFAVGVITATDAGHLLGITDPLRAVIIGGAAHTGAHLPVADLAHGAVGGHGALHTDVALGITGLAVGALGSGPALHTGSGRRITDALSAVAVGQTGHTGVGRGVTSVEPLGVIRAVLIGAAPDAPTTGGVTSGALATVFIVQALTAPAPHRITGGWRGAVLIPLALPAEAGLRLAAGGGGALICGGIATDHTPAHQGIADLAFVALDACAGIFLNASAAGGPALAHLWITLKPLRAHRLIGTTTPAEAAIYRLQTAVAGFATVGVGDAHGAGR